MSENTELEGNNQPELNDILEGIDERIRLLEEEPLSLEESYRIFSEGMELVKQGNSTIDRVEKELSVLMGDEDE